MRARWQLLYNPDNHEDLKTIKVMQQARDTKIALWDFDQWLRGEIKYGTHKDDAYAAFEKCREKLWESLKEYGISIDDT